MTARTRAIAKKEAKQLFRDKRFLGVLLFFPVFYLGLFGYAVNFDIHNIRIAILDKDNSYESRELTNSMLSTSYFTLTKNISSDGEIKKFLDQKDAQVVMVIPDNFSEKLHSKQNVKLQFLIDGVDGNAATIISNYVRGVALSYSMEFQTEMLARLGKNVYSPIQLEPIFWFNPALESSRFFIPGLIAIILIVTGVVSVALSLVKEKERGTIEQINVSSINIVELLIGKSLPYIILCLVDAVFILVLGYLLFGVVVEGSMLLLFITTLIFIAASTSIGIFISAISDSQQVAFSIALFASLLPSVILSGFVFPIESMPFIIKIITNITPSKFFIVLLRGIILKGAGFFAMWDQVVYLILYIIIFLGLASIVSKKKEKAA